MTQTADRLARILAATPLRLADLSDADASQPSAPGQWSKKQVLGHLIDSAANNHQRFIRMQLTPELHFPGYEQNAWVNLNHYATRPWRELVTLWAAYNRHLADVIEHIAPETLAHIWDYKEEARYDLEFVATDYVVHLRHHVEQILRN